MAGTVSRGSVVQTTINTIFFKPSIRKAYHRKSSMDTVLAETVKMDAEDEGNYIYNNKSKSDEYDDESEERWHSQQVMMMMNDENCNSNCSSGSNIGWVPHERTGIYYPKGQEKIMDNVPSSSSSGVSSTKLDVDFTVNWFNSN